MNISFIQYFKYIIFGDSKSFEFALEKSRMFISRKNMIPCSIYRIKSGWIFLYQSRQFIESGNMDEFVMGIPRIYIRQFDGKAFLFPLMYSDVKIAVSISSLSFLFRKPDEPTVGIENEP